MAYGSNSHSPSLRKNESTMRYSRGSPRRSFTLGRLLGDPFALATVSIAILGWLLAFIAAIIGDIHLAFNNYVWWSVVYLLCCIVGIIVMIGADAVYTYHVAAVGFLSCGLFLATSAINTLIYAPDSAKVASAAGFILLSIVTIIWIFYFGAQPQAGPRVFIDSFALHKSMEDHATAPYDNSGNESYMQSQPHQHPASTHLQGFETSSPVINQTSANGTINNLNRDSDYQPIGTGTASNGLGVPHTQPTTAYSGDSEVPTPTNYPYKARAIYAYEANADDPNEISFAKHEILEVSDVSGRWWQARKSNGETGIAPSNYLMFL